VRGFEEKALFNGINYFTIFATAIKGLFDSGSTSNFRPRKLWDIMV